MTKTYYQIKGFLKHSEQDVYSDGCLPDTSQSFFIDHLIQKDSLSDLIESIEDFTDCDDIELDACDEQGRIDAQVAENALGIKASDKELESWEKGECDLYLCTYSAYVVKITETPVTSKGI